MEREGKSRERKGGMVAVADGYRWRAMRDNGWCGKRDKGDKAMRWKDALLGIKDGQIGDNGGCESLRQHDIKAIQDLRLKCVQKMRSPTKTPCLNAR